MRDSMAPAVLPLAALACLCLLWGSGCGGAPGDGNNGGDNGNNGGTGTTFSGTVVNAEDVTQPIAGATVSWTSVTAAAASARQTTTTNASGAFTLSNVPDGSGRLTVTPPGTEFGGFSIDLGSPEAGADVRVPLVSRATQARITGIAVTPQTAHVPFGGQQQFDLDVDITGDGVVLIQPLWLINSGVGTIDRDGLFTAGSATGFGSVLGMAAGLTAAATVTVGNNVVPPSDLALVLNADPSPATPGATVQITATITGASGTPTCRWSTATPPLEGSGTTVTWTAPDETGIYSVSCYAYDSTGATVTGTLAVSVGEFGQIVFHSSRNESDGLYIMRDDGADVTRLSPPDVFEDYPVWSPDGSKLACLSHRSGQMELYVMNADGSDAHPVTSGQITYLIEGEWIAWSSDSAHLVFTGTAAGGEDEIFVVNADGTGRQQITDMEGYDWHPSWQPGGDRIVFCHENGNVEGEMFDIWSVGSDGSGPVNLTSTPDDAERDPVWSPDGTKILYSHWANDGFEGQCYVMSASGSNRHCVSDTSHREVPCSWSPDGSKILFWSDRDSEGGRLYVMNADGSGVVRLADVQPTGEPSWAPDSLRVAFSAWYNDPQPGIWVGYANGSPARRLTTDAHDYEWVAWRP